MPRLPKLYKHNNRTYSSNCARGNHSGCNNYKSTCDCKCHVDKKFTGYIMSKREEINKKARAKYASMSKIQREDRNEHVRYMRKTGQWEE